ncbi:hypothetical protein K461DRAFT_61553 [Myriangium duriaei CBS 260.36]|uniref:Uncharacterized protein n=1 Tax=Myriangium duriaei CBS 260.36 TaxID=1168546 RepID=A0A9P4ITE4_9PEZI|nr:hypothetical protein K461DRAFT_61553 [Myriangium duriaei CBS 260.36]
MDMGSKVDDGPEAIFDAASLARAQLEQCCSHPMLNEEHWAQNRIADFNLWSSGVGATAKKHMSLDVRLQDDDAARAVVTGTLYSLAAWARKCADLAGEGVDAQESHQPGILNTSIKTVSPGTTINSAAISTSDFYNNNGDEPEITLTEARNTIEELLHALVVMGLTIRHVGAASRHREADRTFDFDSNLPEYQELKAHLEFRLRLPLVLGFRKADRNFDRPWALSFEAFSSSSSELLSPEQRTLVKATLKRRHRIRFAQTQGIKLKDSQSRQAIEPTKYSNIADTRSARGRIATHNKTIDTIGPGSSAQDPEKLAYSTVSKPSDYAPGQLLQQNLQARSVAATTVAMRADYPKPPSPNLGIGVFQCPYCCLTFPIELLETTSLWR